MIKIYRPELEALITERMNSGTFHDVEDVIAQALKSSPAGEAHGDTQQRRPAGGKSLAELYTESPFLISFIP